MATALTNGNSIGLYHSSAHIEGGTQEDQAACLGGKRALSRVPVLQPRFTSVVPQIVIEHVAGFNGEGEAQIAASAASGATYTAPSGTAGSEVTIADGAYALVEDTTASKCILISREGTADFAIADTLSFELTKIYNNAIAGSDIGNTARAAGVSTYRGLLFRNDSALSVTNLTIWIATLGTQRTTDSAQLGGAGAGTITTTGSFADWPTSGYAHIKTNVPATKEIVYYTSRTATSLTVPAAGRGLLGTSATAGAATDTVDAVPGVRLSYETPTSEAIQTVADENTAPSAPAPTWSTGTTAATGLVLASLATGVNHGLWIHRQIPAGATGTAAAEVRLNVSFTYNAVSYSETLYGLYAIEDTTFTKYSLYTGIDADPDLSGATSATSATLPFNFALTPPGAGTREYRYVVLERDRHNLLSLNRYLRSVVIDTAGDEVTANPTAPEDVSITDGEGGEILITARYRYQQDASAIRADYFRVYWETDGTDPDPSTDTPTAISVTASTSDGPDYFLVTSIGPFAKGATVKVLVRTYSSVTTKASTNTTATSLTVGTITQLKPKRRRAFWGSYRGQIVTPDTVSSTTYYSQPNDVRAVMAPGITTLYWGATEEVMRLKYDSGLDTSVALGMISDIEGNNGIWSTYEVVTSGSISGASSGPVEYVSTTEGYIAVDDVRRMKIDVTGSELNFEAIRHVALADVPAIRTSNPIHEQDGWTTFQVWDRATFDYVTVAALRYDGVFYIGIPWKHVSATGDIR